MFTIGKNQCSRSQEYPIKSIIQSSGSLPTEIVIHRLNQKITGWANYYRGVVSSKVFAMIDSEIFLSLKRWALKRHPNKGKLWIINKYYTTVNGNHWRFHCTVKDKEGKKKILYLKQAADTLIRHHKKIKAEANPFNPCYAEYFRQRAIERKLSSNSNATQIANSAGLKFIQPYAGLSKSQDTQSTMSLNLKISISGW